MDTITASLIREVLTDAIKILGPLIVAAFVAYRTSRAQFDIEKIRLFDKDRAEAYKKLLRFARVLRNRTFPLAEGKRQVFKEIMEKYYFDSLDIDSVYYNEQSIRILDKLESHYICMTNPDLIPEISHDEEECFLNSLYQLAEDIIEQIRQDTKSRGVSN